MHCYNNPKSNQHVLMPCSSGAEEIDETVQKAVMKDVRHHFRPEFLNRLDDVVLFKPLVRVVRAQIDCCLMCDARS